MDLLRFIEQRTTFNELLDTKKAQYYHELIDANQGDQKQLFVIFNKMRQKTTEVNLPDHESSEQLANDFSAFFSDKIAKINDSFTDHKYDLPVDLSTRNMFTTFHDLSETLVRKVILQSPSKSCLLDPMPTSVLKSCIDEVVPITTRIFNLSLRSGIVPSAFKQAVVTPLQKKKAAGTVFSNYRPVSNLPFLSKILERLVLQQLTAHCTTNKLFDPNQSAYRQGHSTETALLKIFDDLLTAMDTQLVSILTLLDLSAAFDTVHHGILLDRLDSVFGIQQVPLNWFQSYLANRFQRVKIQGSLSSSRMLVTGVPQGSGMGPWAYTSYTREIGCVILLFSIIYHLFADDTQLLKSMSVKDLRSQLQAKTEVEDCAVEISKWMNANRLKLNGDKTEVILIGTPRQLNKVEFSSINICGSEISTKPVVKNLGVFIDSDLKMKSQVNHVVKVCYSALHMLRKLKHHLSKQAMHTLVQAFVISRLDYANSLYYGIPGYLMSKLQRVPKSAARLVCNLQFRDPVTPALIELHWLPVQQRCTYKIALTTFKCLHNNGPSYLKDLLVVNRQSRALRSADTLTLRVPRAKLKYAGCRSFRVAAPCIWNELPRDIRATNSIICFKSKLKYYLFTKAYSDYL